MSSLVWVGGFDFPAEIRPAEQRRREQLAPPSFAVYGSRFSDPQLQQRYLPLSQAGRERVFYATRDLNIEHAECVIRQQVLLGGIRGFVKGHSPVRPRGASGETARPRPATLLLPEFSTTMAALARKQQEYVKTSTGDFVSKKAHVHGSQNLYLKGKVIRK